jgi:hypothetical protein
MAKSPPKKKYSRKIERPFSRIRRMKSNGHLRHTRVENGATSLNNQPSQSFRQFEEMEIVSKMLPAPHEFGRGLVIPVEQA